MKTNKKTAALLLLIMALIVSACSSNGGNSAGNSGTPSQGTGEGTGNTGGTASPVEIKIYGSWGPEQARGVVLQERIDAFNAANAGKINVTMDLNSEWTLYLEKVKTMIAADQTPDLFTFNFNPMDLSRQQSGKLLDFNAYMDDEWRSRFMADELNAMVVDGELNSIPFERSGLLFYYNQDLFAQADIERFPQTWDEFFEACEKLQAIGIAPISLMTVGDAWMTVNLFSYLIGSAGGMNTLSVGNSLDTPEMVKAVETLRNMFNYTTADALGSDYNVAYNHFVLEETAILVDGPWSSVRVQDEMEANIGVAGGPTFGDGKATPGFIVTDAYTPWAGGKQASKEKEQAIADFMRFLTNEESTKEFALKGGVSMSAKLELTEEEAESMGPVMASFTETVSQAPESLVQLSRVIKPAAIAALPSLIEQLVLDQITAHDFVKQLEAENQ